MNLTRTVCLGFVAVLAWCVAPPASADDDVDGYNAAVFLLQSAVRPSRDGTHDALLRGLRVVQDPAMQPMFNALSGSEHLSQRVHGLLGLAQISPDQRVDLADLAEIKDKAELVGVLSGAIDDELIDAEGMATVLNWDGLDLAVRQGVALRLMGKGETVDVAAFRDSLDIAIDDQASVSQLLQYALAALLLAESGEAAGVPAFEALIELEGSSADAVLAQVLDAGMRQGVRAAGPLGLAVAQQRSAQVAFVGVNAALRFDVEGAESAWLKLYDAETSTSRRYALSLLVLDVASHVDPVVFERLERDEGELMRQVGEAGRSISKQKSGLTTAMKPLLARGLPLVADWLLSKAERLDAEQAPAVYEQVIRNFSAGENRHRERLVQAAIRSVHAYVQRYPDQASARLPALLAEPAKDKQQATIRRQIVLMGIARMRGTGLKELVQAITDVEHEDFTIRSLSLLLRARHGASLNDKDWVQVSDIVQGVGNINLDLRVQFAWAYLKHMGKAEQAIAKMLK